jgi:hypothetical protein
MSNVKLNTKISSFADVQKSLQSIEKYLNELSKSVNATAEKDISDKDGKTGDIKTTRNADGTYTFEVRTEEGWKTPSLGDSFVKFKDKSASFSQNKLESIDEIERVDTNTGDSRANLTTFDEKNNKFIMPRPDYDSGWVIWDFSIVDEDITGLMELTHDLSVLPSTLQLWYAPDLNSAGATSGASPNIDASAFSLTGATVDSSIITWAVPINSSILIGSHDYGISIKLDTTKIYLKGGEAGTLKGNSFLGTGEQAKNMTDGYIRLLLWK